MIDTIVFPNITLFQVEKDKATWLLLGGDGIYRDEFDQIDIGSVIELGEKIWEYPSKLWSTCKKINIKVNKNMIDTISMQSQVSKKILENLSINTAHFKLKVNLAT